MCRVIRGPSDPQVTLVDPSPDVRATTAKAFGTLANGLPEECAQLSSSGTTPLLQEQIMENCAYLLNEKE